MKARTTLTKPHRSWFHPRTPRTVDKKGVAVALAFLVAITALAGGRGEKPVETNGGENRGVASTPVEYRLQAATSYDATVTLTDRPITPFRQEPEVPEPHSPTPLSQSH